MDYALHRIAHFLLLSFFMMPIPEVVATARAQSATTSFDAASISEDDIDQRSKLSDLITRKHWEREDVIDALLKERKRIQQAEKYGVGPAAADVDGSYFKICSRLGVTPEGLTDALANKGIRTDTLKQYVRAIMAQTNLVNLCRSEGAGSKLCVFRQ